MIVGRSRAEGRRGCLGRGGALPASAGVSGLAVVCSYIEQKLTLSAGLEQLSRLAKLVLWAAGLCGAGAAYHRRVLFGARDALPGRPHRVLVAGTSGVGKTSLAARLGEAFELPHVEIDALCHGPGWTPRDSFAAEVEAFSAQPEWVTEWQYGAVRALLAGRTCWCGSTCPEPK